MKKTFINPEIMILKVDLSQMIASSESVTETMSFGEDINTTSCMDSRQSHSLWDDENDDY